MSERYYSQFIDIENIDMDDVLKTVVHASKREDNVYFHFNYEVKDRAVVPDYSRIVAVEIDGEIIKIEPDRE